MKMSGVFKAGHLFFHCHVYRSCLVSLEAKILYCAFCLFSSLCSEGIFSIIFEQVIPESESDYCRVVFESSLQDQTYSLCVASHSPGKYFNLTLCAAS